MKKQSTKFEFKVKGEELLKFVKELIREGNVRRIIIKDDQGKPYVEIPVTIGVIGFVLAPILVAVGALAAMTGVFHVEVIKREDKKPVAKKKTVAKKAPVKKSTTKKTSTKTTSKKK